MRIAFFLQPAPPPPEGPCIAPAYSLHFFYHCSSMRRREEWVAGDANRERGVAGLGADDHNHPSLRDGWMRGQRLEEGCVGRGVPSCQAREPRNRQVRGPRLPVNGPRRPRGPLQCRRGRASDEVTGV